MIHRGGKGVIGMHITEKTGHLVAMKGVFEEDDLMIVTAKGQIIRQHVKGIRVIGRNSQGVRLIRLDKDDHIADIARVVKEEE